MDKDESTPNGDVDGTNGNDHLSSGDHTSGDLPAPVSKDDFNIHLQAELDRYKRDSKALQEEFNTVEEEDSPAAVKKALIVAAPDAIQMVIALASHGDTDGIRLNASKYIIDVALGKVKIEANSDGFDNLIKGLMQEKNENDAKKKSKKQDTP